MNDNTENNTTNGSQFRSSRREFFRDALATTLATSTLIGATNEALAQDYSFGATNLPKQYAVLHSLTGSIDPNVDLMQKIYSKIVDSLALGTSSPYPNHSYLILLNPGVIIDPSLDMTLAKNKRTFSETLDTIPYPGWVYNPSSDFVGDIYTRLISDARFANLQITQQEKDLLKTVICCFSRQSWQ